jgi:hypothetical protein
MKASAKLVSALVIAAATAFAVPAQAAWSSQLSQPWLGHNAVLLNGVSPAMLHGRQVIAMNGHRVGTVVGMDRINGMVRIRTQQGVISVPAAGMRRFGGDLLALNTTRRDLLAMARRQG